jgi:pilus assembly protein Flp/PilA
MLVFLNNFKALAKAQHGVTALEYALIGSLIAVVIVTSVTLFGTRLQTAFIAIAAAVP